MIYTENLESRLYGHKFTAPSGVSTHYIEIPFDSSISGFILYSAAATIGDHITCDFEVQNPTWTFYKRISYEWQLIPNYPTKLFLPKKDYTTGCRFRLDYTNNTGSSLDFVVNIIGFIPSPGPVGDAWTV